MSWGVATQNGVSVSLASIVSLSCGATEFSPASLFTSGVAGAWYDPSDTSTLFQDSAGTTPVTAVEQPVGLMLDKSQGATIGPEIIANYTTGWTAVGTANVALSGVEVIATADGSSNTPGFYYAITTVVGQQYYVTGALRSPTTNTMYLGANTAVTLPLSGNTINRASSFSSTATQVGFFFTAVGTTTYITVYGTTSTAGNAYAGQSISVRLRPGNHASQATAASRPILRARYNLLTYSEQFDNAGWTKTALLAFGSGSVVNATTAPDGTTTADLITENTVNDTHVVNQLPSVLATTAYTITTYFKRATGTRNAYIQANNNGSGTGGACFASYDLGAGTASAVTDLVAGFTSKSATITDVGNGWYRCALTLTTVAGTTTLGIYHGIYNAARSYVGDGTSGIYIWGADLRTGSSAGTYQRIAAATDYATAGFLPYLAGDGVDDQMSSNSINLTATDKLTAVFGTLSNSTANQGVLQFGASGAGTMNALYLFGSTLDMRSSLQGSTGNSQMRIAGSGVGVANVYSELYDIAGATAADESQIRVNGTLPTQFVQSAGPAGGGNFANTALTIFQFSGSFFLNGRIYQLIVCGKTLSASELASTEAYVATKTGVVI